MNRFNIKLISERLKPESDVRIIMVRNDRTIASVVLHSRKDRRDPSLTHIWATAHGVHDENLATLRLPLQTPEEARELGIAKFMQDIDTKLNLYNECRYCSRTYLDAFCSECSVFDYLSTHQECIVCKQTEHAIRFRCKTCIDSNVCLLCTHNQRWAGVCPTCKLPEVRFGKRCREDSEDESDEDQ
jgi:hypothetical protein